MKLEQKLEIDEVTVIDFNNSKIIAILSLERAKEKLRRMGCKEVYKGLSDVFWHDGYGRWYEIR